MRVKTFATALTAASLILLAALPNLARADLAKGETEKIAEEAFLYGFPVIMNYGIFYQYFIDKASPEYKTPINQIYNTARVYTPKDTAVVTPNSDTPYSFVALDLRSGPFVICNPAIEDSRYFSIQLVNLYTFNFGYIGSRTTGNGAGCFMIVGPRWRGVLFKGLTKMFRSETDFMFAIFRTQLFNPADIDNVKKIQDGYLVERLARFRHLPPRPIAPDVKWKTFDKSMAASDPFSYLNFLLEFCPTAATAAVELPLRQRFAKIGIEPGKPFPSTSLTPDQKAELAAGIKSGLEKIKQAVADFGQNENGWRVAAKPFGTRKAYAGNWTFRAAVAMAGIYANDPKEALYPLLATDSEGNKPDCSTNRYTLTFPAGQLPPVNAFWSVTMYDGKTQLLVDNPINRYLINSPMLPNLKKNPDGSITIYIQKDSPGADKDSNWLPAPNGPIYVAMRLYWPKDSALDGSWKPPAVVRVK
jgi:hypothetical protein